MKLLLCAALALLAISASAAPIIKVSAVQMRSAAELDKNLEKITKFLEKLACDGVQIAVFPEYALTSGDADVVLKLDKTKLDAAFDAIGQACKKNNIAAVVGAASFRPDGKLWNSAFIFDTDGKVIERYHKVHLAEEWPEPGDHLAFFDIAGTKATIIICHDERYPELVRIPVIAGARLVFYISSESGVKSESKIGPYRAQIQARASENCVWIVHSNAPANDDATGSHGQSRIIIPDGNILSEAGIFDETVVTAEIDMSRASGLYANNSLNALFLKDFWQAGLKALEKK